MTSFPRYLLAFPVLLLVSVLSFTTLRPIQVLPRISVGPGYAFTNQDGERLTNEDLRGDFVLYNFTHTRCTDPCPQTGAVMRQLQERLQSVDTGGIDVRLVTISFDPENDTPQRLQTYAQQWNADGEQWQVVTGEPFLVKQVIGNGFRTYYQQQKDGRFDFDPAFVLTDGWGILRAEYRTATPDPETVARDVKLIAQEAHNSQGAARYAYEAAHLFLCYPR